MRRCGPVLVAGLLGVGALTACVSEPPPEPFDGKVFKYDGSVQCGSSGISVEEMSRELTNHGVDVLCGQKGGDGYLYCAACGCGSGRINVYTIHAENLADVEALGFASVTDLPDYQDEPCTP